MNPLNLPDVSEFQPDVTWPEIVAHNGGAAIIRALYGTGHLDAAWYGGARRLDAHKAGVKALGIYQYLVATEDALAQAEEFVKVVGKLEPGEFAVLDLEEGGGSQLARAEEWLKYVDEHLTYPGSKGAWLYSSNSFFGSAGLMPIADSSRHTWVADYGARPTVPHTLWQNSQATQWPGIPKACDNSVFDGDLAKFLEEIGTQA
jgi:GH25 family lysozyme M1 (1,4-beta-N-acetylmuramidase)